MFSRPRIKTALMKLFDQGTTKPTVSSPRATNSADMTTLQGHYETEVEAFYDFLPPNLKTIFVNDAIYHKRRYLDMIDRQYGRSVLELGSDKPFITHCLRTLHGDSTFTTISVDVPFSPYPIIRLDIEADAFPFPDESVDDVIFTEVLEHLFRNPAWVLYQMNRVLRPQGRLFLTTPNACGYDALQNLIEQKNPNERNQFYERIESGHPHLWTAAEVRLILESHGFDVVDLRTVDYYDIPLRDDVAQFIRTASVAPDRHGQVLRVEARRARVCGQPIYPPEIFPDGKPVHIVGALQKWISSGT